MGNLTFCMYVPVQALAFERLLLVVKTQPVTNNLPHRPRIAEVRPVNENLTLSYPVRSMDAHQRVPLEPLFQVDTEAQPAAQPMSIDSSSDLHSTEAQAQSHAIDGNGPAVDHDHAKEGRSAQHNLADAATLTEENDAVTAALASPIKTDNPAQVSLPRYLLVLVLVCACTVTARKHLCVIAFPV